MKKVKSNISVIFGFYTPAGVLVAYLVDGKNEPRALSTSWSTRLWSLWRVPFYARLCCSLKWERVAQREDFLLKKVTSETFRASGLGRGGTYPLVVATRWARGYCSFCASKRKQIWSLASNSDSSKGRLWCYSCSCFAFASCRWFIPPNAAPQPDKTLLGSAPAELVRMVPT